MPAADPTTPVQYRDIPGWPGYRVGDDGTVWSSYLRGGRPSDRRTVIVPWRRLRFEVKKRGYLCVTLVRSNAGSVEKAKRMVHRLVLEAFVGPRPPGQEARHFPDRTTSNNALSNLRWGTRSENARDRITHGTAGATCRGEASPGAKLTNIAVLEIRQRHSAGEAQVDLAREFRVGKKTIAGVIHRYSWKHI